MLQVTPNGSHPRGHHPGLPVTLDEVAADVGGCLRAGATGVHLHVRDAAGAETLDPVAVAAHTARMRSVARGVGAPVEVGLTTGAWIVPDLDERLARLREWEGVDCATVNVGEPGFERVMATLVERGIGVDAGVWRPAEVAVLAGSGLLPHLARVSIELAPGPGAADHPVALAREVGALLDDAGWSGPRLLHGEGPWTWALVAHALEQGLDTRVGFEDSVLLPDDRPAPDNAALVAAAMALPGPA